MTIGRLNSAASSVAVPLATSATSQAASTACDRPSSNCSGTPGACAARSGSTTLRSPGTSGSTKRRAGRWRCSKATACRKTGAMDSTSERRLPGSTATTAWSSARPSAARLAARGGESGIASASGWPTKVAATPCARSSSGSKGKRQST